MPLVDMDSSGVSSFTASTLPVFSGSCRAVMLLSEPIASFKSAPLRNARIHLSRTRVNHAAFMAVVPEHVLVTVGEGLPGLSFAPEHDTITMERIMPATWMQVSVCLYMMPPVTRDVLCGHTP